MFSNTLKQKTLLETLKIDVNEVKAIPVTGRIGP
jgi:hypothetical protein